MTIDQGHQPPVPMRPEIEDLRQWYEGRTGSRTALAIASAVAPLIHRSGTARLLALGYCAPVLRGFDPQSVERLIIACPSEQGANVWPDSGPCLATEVDELSLPFTDALFDQTLVMHALEHAAPPRRLLRELWRVLAPGGSIVLVVPNRSGLWVHFETTPFGQGTPYGKRTLSTMLEDALFAIDHHQTLLTIPPARGIGWLDRPVMKVMSGAGGLHLLRARKLDGPAMLPVGRVESGRRARVVPQGPLATPRPTGTARILD